LSRVRFFLLCELSHNIDIMMSMRCELKFFKK
jgi:hypothetical protein